MSRFVLKAAISFAAVTTVLATLPASAQVPTVAATPESVAASESVDPEAMRAMDRMAAYLRTLKSFEIDVNSTIETALPDGQKLQFAGTTKYQVTPPHGFYADVRTDRQHRQFYFDGKKLTMFAPRMRVYTSIDAPGTIRQMLDKVFDRYDITLPLADLFYWGGSAEDVHKPLSAMVVGYARMGDAGADHFAFREDGIDYQLWIQRGDKPLPLKMVITDALDPDRPQYVANMAWNLNPTIPADTFTFKPPANVSKIQAVEVAASEDSNQ